ncbi:hypothetical protein M3Y97_01081300 [Aphelenchoides bicaudatus]|nr:hypothetical protein M3Y97_01081300 [Aphelenchoides bicaudatus]
MSNRGLRPNACIFIVFAGLVFLFLYANQQSTSDITIHGKLAQSFSKIAESKGKRYENLLVDTDCYERLTKQEKCRSPIKVASFALNSSNPNLLIDYLLEMPEECDFLTLNGPTKRLLPKYLRDSRFIESKRLQMNRTKNEESLNSTLIKKGIRKFRQKMEKFSRKLERPFSYFLTGGTLLGWYREGRVIPHTTDVDFAIRREDLGNEPDDFIRLFESTFHMRDRLGFENDSLELRFTLYGLPVDLFVWYNDKNDSLNRDYVPGIDFNNKQELRWYAPHVDDICAGNLLNSIVYVPCNVEGVLTAFYGDWKTDFPSSNYYYVQGPSLRRGRKYSRREWRQAYKKPPKIQMVPNKSVQTDY